MKHTALITGASSGIGLDLAHLFARDGHDLILVARSVDKLQALAEELAKKHNIAAHVIASDLAQRDAPQALFDAVRAKGLQVDVLVNNAGFGFAGKFIDTPLATELDMVEVNINAVLQLTKLFLKPMAERRSGRILNVASTAGFQPGPLMSVYYASKAFVLSFSEALAEEMRGSGVTVTALCPGPTATNFAAAANTTATRLFNLTKPMSSMAVARAGYDGMKRGKRVVIAGVTNKIGVQALRVSPRRVVTKLVRALQENRR